MEDRTAVFTTVQLTTVFFWLMVFSAALGAGCAHSPRTQADTSVAHFPTASAVDLDAEQTVQLLKMAGYTNEQILELGPRVRNGLATEGGARILQNGKVGAVFAATEEGHVHVVTASGVNVIFRPKDFEPR